MPKPIFRVTGALLLLALTPISHGAFELKKPKTEPEVIQEPSPVFDQGEYEVWVDHTYTAVVEYGSAGSLQRAPSYGDPMSLEEALKLLVPDKWKVMKSRELTEKGSINVEWDVERANWVQVLKNLGERHGLRFHVDHNNQAIHVQNGRKLVTEQARVAAITTDSHDSNGELSSRNSGPAAIEARHEDLSESATFTLKEGENAEQVLADLALMLGYEQSYWLMGRKTIEQTQTIKGEPMDVLSRAAEGFDGRVCLYEQDRVAAFVNQSTECPK